MKKVLKEKDLNSIISLYESGESCSSIALKYVCAAQTINSFLRKHGHSVRNCSNRYKDLKIREKFFLEINSETKAYLLGYLWADGHISKNGYYLVLDLSEKDEIIVDALIHYIYDGCSPKKSYRTINDKHYVKCCICSKKIVQSLINLGFKEKEKIPEISNRSLFRHFLRGVFDGDGSIAINENRYYFFLLGEKKLLEEIQKILIDELKIKKTKIIDIGNIWRLSVTSIKDIFLVLDFIYKDSKIFLERKKKRFESFLHGKNIEYYLNKVKSSKYTGVCFDKSRNKWIAKYGKKNLGRFETEELAYEAREKMKIGVTS